MKWPWSRRGREPHPEIVAAERHAEELEQRAAAAAEPLMAFLRRRDSWAGPVLKTIHGQRGPHAR